MRRSLRSFTLARDVSNMLDELVEASPDDPRVRFLFPPSIETAAPAPQFALDEHDLFVSDYPSLYVIAGQKPAKEPAKSTTILWDQRFSASKPEWHRFMDEMVILATKSPASASLAQRAIAHAKELGKLNRRAKRKAETAARLAARKPRNLLNTNASRVVDAVLLLGFRTLQERLTTIEIARSSKGNAQEGGAQRAGRKANKTAEARAV